MALLNDDYRHQGMRKQLVHAIRNVSARVKDGAVLLASGSVPRHVYIYASAFVA